MPEVFRFLPVMEPKTGWGRGNLRQRQGLDATDFFPGTGYLVREALNKSSAAEQRIFFSIRAVSKVGNTSSIPPLLKLSAEEKSLAVSTCRFVQRFPGIPIGEAADCKFIWIWQSF